MIRWSPKRGRLFAGPLADLAEFATVLAAIFAAAGGLALFRHFFGA